MKQTVIVLGLLLAAMPAAAQTAAAGRGTAPGAQAEARPQRPRQGPPASSSRTRICRPC